MQRLPARETPARPGHPQTSKSFVRSKDPPKALSGRSRANTVAGSASQDADPESPSKTERSDDVFDTPVRDQPENHDEGEQASFPEGFEDLPIEIQSLMERFLESLAAKVHPAPLTIERLSELFQDFYEHAYAQINTHVAALAIRMGRENSPVPAPSAMASIALGPKRKQSTKFDQAEQLLTATEVSDKRKARRQLEIKRLAMEEAVERGVCEKVYPRIWRHPSTDDEARDEKLRSRAAALSLLGVDLRELLSTAGSSDTDTAEMNAEEPDSAMHRLAEARKSLEQMNDERHPYGKLNHLTLVHKAIVEALQKLFPSASSADEVLPTLIYTIINLPPNTNHIVSNFNFIQRFRASTKIDGEAAYCLTNLEAAISFLENVDLSTIRSSELPEGPPRTASNPATPRLESPNPMYRGLPSESPEIRAELKVESRPRSLSGLHPLGAASDAVLSGADNIHTILDSSFKYLWGRLREKQSEPAFGVTEPAPKTLEDAHKLVSQDKGEDGVLDDKSETESLRKGLGSDRALNLLGGRLRDRSVDSTKSGQSAGSGRPRSGSVRMPDMIPQAIAYNPVDTMRNLGNAFNPLRSFTMRGFGRSPSTSNAAAPPAIASPSLAAVQEPRGVQVGADGASEKFTDAAKAFDWAGVAPPVQRFVECIDSRSLNGFETELLLRDYQRLAGAVRAAQASNI